SLFFFNDTPPTTLYTLSLHDALPISKRADEHPPSSNRQTVKSVTQWRRACMLRFSTNFLQRSNKLLIEKEKMNIVILAAGQGKRSEEHTSELQSRENLVCRLLLEKKK